jgi:hypothetical protein
MCCEENLWFFQNCCYKCCFVLFSLTNKMWIFTINIDCLLLTKKYNQLDERESWFSPSSGVCMCVWNQNNPWHIKIVTFNNAKYFNTISNKNN